MSAAATSPVVSPNPAPTRDTAAAFPRINRLLHIVRQLVAYGNNLINTLEHGASHYRRMNTMMSFGTRDLALIIARIKCGLRRAAALQARLHGYIDRGRDLTLPGPARPMSAAAASRAAAGDAPPPRPARSQVLSLLPSAEEIAEQVRTRRLGTVIGDICRDMGLSWGQMNGVLREQMMEAIGECGIEFIGYIRRGIDPVFGTWRDVVAMDVAGLFEEALWLEPGEAAAGQPP
jgi:hypothetical protein